MINRCNLKIITSIAIFLIIYTLVHHTYRTIPFNFPVTYTKLKNVRPLKVNKNISEAQIFTLTPSHMDNLTEAKQERNFEKQNKLKEEWKLILFWAKWFESPWENR